MSTAAAGQTQLYSDRTLRDYCRSLLQALGVPEGHARVVCDSLVEANVRGVDSHGIQMLSTYISQVKAGGVKVGAVGRVVAESGVCLTYDGENGLGQVIADICADHAVRLVKSAGMAMVVARNAHHFGAAAYWAEKISRAGYIGIVMCNASPATPPWQGRSPRLGTNPFCVTVPGSEAGGWLLDMSTTTVALGKLAHAANLNQSTIPAWWGFLDQNSRSTTDTQTAMSGLPTPIGGYKGTGLAMMVEILCSGLSGGPMALEVPIDRKGSEPLHISHTFIAIDPARFLPVEEFKGRVGRLGEMMKSSEPAPGFTEILNAGEPERRAEAKRRVEGIPIPVRLMGHLTAIGSQLGIAPPQTFSPAQQK